MLNHRKIMYCFFVIFYMFSASFAMEMKEKVEGSGNTSIQERWQDSTQERPHKDIDALFYKASSYTFITLTDVVPTPVRKVVGGAVAAAIAGVWSFMSETSLPNLWLDVVTRTATDYPVTEVILNIPSWVAETIAVYSGAKLVSNDISDGWSRWTKDVSKSPRVSEQDADISENECYPPKSACCTSRINKYLRWTHSLGLEFLDTYLITGLACSFIWDTVVNNTYGPWEYQYSLAALAAVYYFYLNYAIHVYPTQDFYKNTFFQWLYNSPEQQEMMDMLDNGQDALRFLIQNPLCNLHLMSELPKDGEPLIGRVYLKRGNSGLKYKILGSQGEAVKGECDISINSDLTLEVLNTWKSEILKEISKRDHIGSLIDTQGLAREIDDDIIHINRVGTIEILKKIKVLADTLPEDTKTRKKRQTRTSNGCSAIMQTVNALVQSMIGGFIPYKACTTFGMPGHIAVWVSLPPALAAVFSSPLISLKNHQLTQREVFQLLRLYKPELTTHHLNGWDRVAPLLARFCAVIPATLIGYYYLNLAVLPFVHKMLPFLPIKSFDWKINAFLLSPYIFKIWAGCSYFLETKFCDTVNWLAKGGKIYFFKNKGKKILKPMDKDRTIERYLRLIEYFESYKSVVYNKLSKKQVKLLYTEAKLYLRDSTENSQTTTDEETRLTLHQV